MTLATWFWLFYVLSVIFGVWFNYDGQIAWYRRAGVYPLVVILVGILGYAVFGSPIKGH
jgi:hypothetical protein